jgi:hypothetical protein
MNIPKMPLRSIPFLTPQERAQVMITSKHRLQGKPFQNTGGLGSLVLPRPAKGQEYREFTIGQAKPPAGGFPPGQSAAGKHRLIILYQGDDIKNRYISVAHYQATVPGSGRIAWYEII